MASSKPTTLPLSAARGTQAPPAPIIISSPSSSIIPIRAPLSSDDHDSSDDATLASDDDGFETASDPGEPSPESAVTVRDSALMPPVARRPVAQLSFDDDDDTGEEVFEEGLAEEVDGDFPAVARVPLSDQDSSLTDEGEVLDEAVDDGVLGGAPNPAEESKGAVLGVEEEHFAAAGAVGDEIDSLVASGAGAVDGDEENGVPDMQREKDENLNNESKEVGGVVLDSEASGSPIMNEIADAEPATSVVLDARGKKDEDLNDGPEEVGGLVVEQKEASEPENTRSSSVMDEIADAKPANSAILDAQDEKDEQLEGSEEARCLSAEQKEASEPENSPASPIKNENANTEPANSVVSDGQEPANSVVLDAQDEKDEHLINASEEVGGLSVEQRETSELANFPASLIMDEIAGAESGDSVVSVPVLTNGAEEHSGSEEASGSVDEGVLDLKLTEAESDVSKEERDGAANADDSNDNLLGADELEQIQMESDVPELGKVEKDGVADASDLNKNLVGAEEPKHDGVEADAVDTEETGASHGADASDSKKNLVGSEEPKHDGVEPDAVDTEEIGASHGADASDSNKNLVGAEEPKHDGVEADAVDTEEIGASHGTDSFQNLELSADDYLCFTNGGSIDDAGVTGNTETLEGGPTATNPEIADDSLVKLDAVHASEAVYKSAFPIQEIGDEKVGSDEKSSILKIESNVSENPLIANDTVNQLDALHASEAVDRSAFLIQEIGDKKVGADSELALILKAEPNFSETESVVVDGDFLVVPEVKSQSILVEEFKSSETELEVSETSGLAKEENSGVVFHQTPTSGCVLGLEEDSATDAFHMADDDETEDPKVVEEKQEDLVSDRPARVAILESSEAAKLIIKELEEGSSSASTYSGFGSSRDYSNGMDGQVASDSEEEMLDNDDEGDGKELFDSAALAALLRAATGASSDGSVTVTPADAARIFSIDRPAGLGSSVPSLKPAPARSTRSNIFTPSDLAVAGEPENMNEEERKLHEKVELIRVKFLRLVQRLGHSPEDTVAAQVLYRLGLAEGLRHGRQASRAFSFESARKKALELEVDGKEDLDFSCNILVIGKTGVGKSATVNSIFGAEKSYTNAFDQATTSVKEIVGVVNGVKIRVIDTPGLRASVMDQASNRKILSSIKKYTKKCPPDIVLYVDRMDTQTRDFNDLPLLKSITSALGSSIWFNAIVALTHAASAPPDGPNGYPLSYDVFVTQRSHVVQHSIRQAAGDMRLMNPVAFVENHPSCRRNREGERVLPNGLSWRPQMLLLCYSSKILSEANSLLKLQDPSPGKLFGFRNRSPPLAYLLSSLLQSRSHPKLSIDQGGENADSDVDLDDLSDSDQEEADEYDDLPPFKPLRKSQLANLTKDQRRAYFDEYDYRVKLLQKKQWKQELRRLKEMKQHVKGTQDEFGYGDTGEDFEQDNIPATVPVPMPDMTLPPSFDCDYPVHRYRFLEPTSQLLTRPVLDSHGWDHDCGYDGVSLEHNLAVAGRFPSGASVQITKDKKEFSLHLDSSIAAKHGENGSTLAGFDIQSIGKQLAYFFRGETKFKNLKKNKTAAGISVTFLGETVATGLKVEDELSLGKRVNLVASSGAVRAQGDVAYGANLEARLRDKDYPLGQSLSTLGLSLLRWRGDTALGANLQSQFSVGRNSKMAVRVGLNNKMSGQITIRTSSSEHLQIALMGILPIAMSIYRSIYPGESIPY